MGLLSIVRKLKQKERELRILFLGLDNAGKTTVLRRICGQDTLAVEPTLGFSIKTVERRGFRLNCWDVGGQRSLRTYWRNYFEQTDAVVWLVDSADRRRLDDCRTELHALLQEERLAGANLLILANKQDLPGALSVADISQVLQLDSIKSHNWRILATSAVFACSESPLAQNIIQAIDWLVDDAAARIFFKDFS